MNMRPGVSLNLSSVSMATGGGGPKLASIRAQINRWPPHHPHILKTPPPSLPFCILPCTAPCTSSLNMPPARISDSGAQSPRISPGRAGRSAGTPGRTRCIWWCRRARRGCSSNCPDLSTRRTNPAESRSYKRKGTNRSYLQPAYPLCWKGPRTNGRHLRKQSSF